MRDFIRLVAECAAIATPTVLVVAVFEISADYRKVHIPVAVDVCKVYSIELKSTLVPDMETVEIKVCEVTDANTDADTD